MKFIKELLKNEQGLALPLALIMLVVGVFFAVPVLALVTTSLNYNRAVEANTLELYSADAGIEHAIRKITDAIWNDTEASVLPTEGGMNGPFVLEGELLTLNTMSHVEYTITDMYNRNYKITSTATNDTGHVTTVDCYIYLWNMSALAEGAITSNGDIKILNCTVNGNVYYWGDKQFNNNKDPDGNPLPEDFPILKEQHNWPSLEMVRGFYYDPTAPTLPSDTLRVEDYPDGLPAHYWEGETLSFDSGKGTPIIRLDGNLFVDGNLEIKTKPFILDLNGHAIFVRDEITCNPGVMSIRGTGSIISGGDLNLKPSFVSDPDNPDDPIFIFIMSVAGSATVLPESQAGEVWGCILGYEAVEVQNSNILYVDPGDYEELFPDDRPMVMSYEIQ